MYLMETERPLASQAMLAGSVCYMLNITDRPLITIVIARAITSGCIVAAHTTAKHLSEKKFSASEAEYSKFRESILTHVVGSIEPLKDKMIKDDLEKYLGHARATEMAIIELTAKKILENWEAPRIDEWKLKIAEMYLAALNHCVDKGSDDLDDEKKEKLKMVIDAHCINIAESHWGIFQFFLKELSDLMRVKGVCI